MSFLRSSLSPTSGGGGDNSGAATIRTLQGRKLWPMPTDTPFDPFPDDPQKSLVQKVLVYAFDTDSNAIPVKTLKITNNTEFTVYPVMRDGNEAETQKNSGVGLYDPYDPVKTEYRGYVGYKGTDNEYYFGHTKGETITIRVPLVFRNGSRMGIVTDGTYLAPAAGSPNPLHYSSSSQRVIVAAESDARSIQNGVVMWYRSHLIA